MYLGRKDSAPVGPDLASGLDVSFRTCAEACREVRAAALCTACLESRTFRPFLKRCTYDLHHIKRITVAYKIGFNLLYVDFRISSVFNDGTMKRVRDVRDRLCTATMSIEIAFRRRIKDVAFYNLKDSILFIYHMIC